MVLTSVRNIYCLLFIILCGLLETAQAEDSNRRIDVPVGMILPLTGESAVWGEDVNRLGGILEEAWNKEQQKYRFRLLREDGRCGAGNAAITAAKKLAELDGVRHIVAGCSGEVLQIAPYAGQRKIVVLGYCAGHPDISCAGEYIFRTYIGFQRGIDLLAQAMRANGHTPVAILTEENSFTLGMKDWLMKALGADVAYDPDYAQGDADLRTLIAGAKSRKPRGYYLNTVTPHSFIVLLKQLRQAGVKEQLYAYYNPGDKDVRETLGALLNGIIYMDVPDTDDLSPDFNAVYVEFVRRHPEGPKTPFLMRTGYDALRAMYDCVMAAGPSAESCKNFLYTYSRSGASGPVKFDSNGDRQDVNFVLRTVAGL